MNHLNRRDCRLTAPQNTVKKPSALLLRLALPCLLIAGGAHGDVIINEFMAVNDTTRQDEDGDYTDWIELLNTGTTTVSLSGWYLTDDADDLRKWRLPAVEIPARGFLVVFASGKDRTDPTRLAPVVEIGFGLNRHHAPPGASTGSKLR